MIKNSKIRALILLIVSICLTMIHFTVVDYFGKSFIGIILMMIVVFIYSSAIIASLYVLTNGWIFIMFLGPMDYGYWEE